MKIENYQQRLVQTLFKDRESISKSRLRRCRNQRFILKSRFQSMTAPKSEREGNLLVWVFERIKSLVAIILLLAQSARGQFEQLRQKRNREPPKNQGGEGRGKEKEL